MATLFPFNTPAQMARRRRLQIEGQGYYAENFPLRTIQTGTIGITGTIYLMGIGLCGGDVVTNIHLSVATAGSGFSGINAKVGIYSSASQLLAASGDVSTALSSTGIRTCVLGLTNGAPFTVPSDGYYYVALLSVASTVPVIQRGPNGTKTTFNSQLAFGTMAGQTDLVSTVTIAESANLGYWVGIS